MLFGDEGDAFTLSGNRFKQDVHLKNKQTTKRNYHGPKELHSPFSPKEPVQCLKKPLAAKPRASHPQFDGKGHG